MSLDQLRTWPLNPKRVSREDFERTKRMMKKLGMFKPLIVSSENIPEIDISKGTILGGRTRYYIAKDLAEEGVDGFDPVWVSWVAPKDKNEAIEYALADNDSAGIYIEEDLADLVQDVNIELKDYKINIQDSMTVKDLLDSLSPSEILPDDPSVTPKASRVITCPHCGEEIDL